VLPVRSWGQDALRKLFQTPPLPDAPSSQTAPKASGDISEIDQRAVDTPSSQLRDRDQANSSWRHHLPEDDEVLMYAMSMIGSPAVCSANQKLSRNVRAVSEANPRDSFGWLTSRVRFRYSRLK
jgi:hypothetical protein